MGGLDPDMSLQIGSPYNRKNDPLMDEQEESDYASPSTFARPFNLLNDKDFSSTGNRILLNN